MSTNEKKPDLQTLQAFLDDMNGKQTKDMTGDEMSGMLGAFAADVVMFLVRGTTEVAMRLRFGPLDQFVFKMALAGMLRAVADNMLLAARTKTENGRRGDAIAAMAHFAMLFEAVNSDEAPADEVFLAQVARVKEEAEALRKETEANDESEEAMRFRATNIGERVTAAMKGQGRVRRAPHPRHH